VTLAKPVCFEKDVLTLSFTKEDAFSKDALESAAIKAELEEVAEAFFNTKVKIKTVFQGEESCSNLEEDIDIVAAAINWVGKDKVEVMEE
jgi:hypothetical protein